MGRESNAPVMVVLGTRPEIVKLAHITRILRDDAVVVHTGQHYDAAMSAVFFDELGLPEPDVNLGVGSGSHGQQTAALLVALTLLFLTPLFAYLPRAALASIILVGVLRLVRPRAFASLILVSVVHDRLLREGQIGFVAATGPGGGLEVAFDNLVVAER